MWPGKLRTIRFEFNGPSVQAALDKLPTAKIIECLGGGKYLIDRRRVQSGRRYPVWPDLRYHRYVVLCGSSGISGGFCL